MNSIYNLSNKLHMDSIGKDVTEIKNFFHEDVYLFNPGLNLNYNISDTKDIINSNTFNIFSTYKKEIHLLLVEIKNQYLKMLKENKIDSVSLKPYISAEIVNSKSYDIKKKYDFGTQTAGECFGIFSIVSEKDMDININEDKFLLKESDLGIFSTDQVFEFIEISDNFIGIEFYITGLRNLSMQYYGKWIPML